MKKHIPSIDRIIVSMNNLLIRYLATLAFTTYPTWRIIKRTGLNKYWAALILLPGLGSLSILIMLAFSDWPNTSEGCV